MGSIIKNTSTLFIKELTDSKEYFNILSNEWKDLISPVWNLYKDTAKIYGLYIGEILIGGGIVFSSTPPFTTNFELQHNDLFEKGYLYLGYVWISDAYRKKGYASTFLSLLKEFNPSQKYWLTIEEENLRYFYEQNGFKIYAESENQPTKEWILIT